MNDVIGAELGDKKGNLNQMLAVLAENSINVRYIYSFVIREGRAPVLVFSTDDYEKAASILKDAGVKMVDESDL